MKVGGSEQKKRQKRELLLKSAFELFMEKGPGDTAIDDIVRRAGVAKGTFYLYFRDRNEILKHIVAQKGAVLVRESNLAAKKRGPAGLAEEIVLTVDEFLSLEARNPKLVPLIYKNFSWPLLEAELERLGRGPDSLLARFEAERGSQEAKELFFMITELVVSVAYNAIVRDEPASLDRMRGPLLSALRRMLANEMN